MLNVYDACLSDLANALLQSAKMLAFIEGKYKGTGPSAEKLARRLASGKHTPTRVISEIEETIQGTPLMEITSLSARNVRMWVSFQVKKKMHHIDQSMSQRTNQEIKDNPIQMQVKFPIKILMQQRIC